MSILQSIRIVPLTIILALFILSLVWASVIWLIMAILAWQKREFVDTQYFGLTE